MSHGLFPVFGANRRNTRKAFHAYQEEKPVPLKPKSARQTCGNVAIICVPPAPIRRKPTAISESRQVAAQCETSHYMKELSLKGEQYVPLNED
jgi:hypothetical protein